MLRRVSFYIGLLLALAILVSAWLFSSVLLSASAGTCESGCDELVHGQWGKFAGIPVSALGLLTYAVLFWVNAKQPGRPGLLIGRLAAGLVLGGALWFTGLQIWLGQFCPYCCFAHACAGVATVMWLKNEGMRSPGGEKKILHRPLPAVAAGAAMVLVLAAVQITLRDNSSSTSNGPPIAATTSGSQTQLPAPTENSPASLGRELVLHGGQFRISTSELPIIGSPQADQLAALLFDFTCPHCRQMHAEVAARLGDSGESGVAAILLPVPRSPKASAVHQLMLALWREKPSEYERISHLLVSGKLTATEANVRRAIVAAIGEQVLAQRLATDAVWIQSQIDLAQEVRVANHPEKTLGVPQLMVGGEVLVGFESPRKIAQFLADTAGLRPQPVSREVEIEVVDASPAPDSKLASTDEWTTTIPAPSAEKPPTRIPVVMSAVPLRSERVQVILVNVAGTNAETVKVSVPQGLADLGVSTKTGARTSSGKVPVRLHFPKGFVAPEKSHAIQIDAEDGSRSSTLVAIERAIERAK